MLQEQELKKGFKSFRYPLKKKLIINKSEQKLPARYVCGS